VFFFFLPPMVVGFFCLVSTSPSTVFHSARPRCPHLTPVAPAQVLHVCRAFRIPPHVSAPFGKLFPRFVGFQRCLSPLLFAACEACFFFSEAFLLLQFSLPTGSFRMALIRSPRVSLTVFLAPSCATWYRRATLVWTDGSGCCSLQGNFFLPFPPG